MGHKRAAICADIEQEAVKLVREILKTQGLFDGHATIDQLYIACERQGRVHILYDHR